MESQFGLTVSDVIVAGIFLGAGAVCFWFILGRGFGIGDVIPAFSSRLRWSQRWPRLLFVVGLLIGGGIGLWFGSPDVDLDELAGSPTPLLIAAGGLLTGIGLRLMREGLAGHLIFGLAKQSQRSTVAVGAVFATALVTAIGSAVLFGGAAQ
ncbi:MAG: hypothetical protein C0606_03190 [Hyphomicrobiales bacterium]|nr:MAG: hypothetical protein C0606_03190 [Hyphomicrobiales bacterium]